MRACVRVRACVRACVCVCTILSNFGLTLATAQAELDAIPAPKSDVPQDLAGASTEQAAGKTLGGPLCSSLLDTH